MTKELDATRLRVVSLTKSQTELEKLKKSETATRDESIAELQAQILKLKEEHDHHKEETEKNEKEHVDLVESLRSEIQSLKVANKDGNSDMQKELRQLKRDKVDHDFKLSAQKDTFEHKQGIWALEKEKLELEIETLKTKRALELTSRTASLETLVEEPKAKRQASKKRSVEQVPDPDSDTPVHDTIEVFFEEPVPAPSKSKSKTKKKAGKPIKESPVAMSAAETTADVDQDPASLELEPVVKEKKVTKRKKKAAVDSLKPMEIVESVEVEEGDALEKLITEVLEVTDNCEPEATLPECEKESASTTKTKAHKETKKSKRSKTDDSVEAHSCTVVKNTEEPPLPESASPKNRRLTKETKKEPEKTVTEKKVGTFNSI